MPFGAKQTRGKPRQQNPKVVQYSLGKWPPGSQSIERDVYDFRYMLEQKIAERNGGVVDEHQAFLIYAACERLLMSRMVRFRLNRKMDREMRAERLIAEKAQMNALTVDGGTGMIVATSEPSLEINEHEMPDMVFLAFTKVIGDHSSECVKLLSKLGLDKQEKENLSDVIRSLHVAGDGA